MALYDIICPKEGKKLTISAPMSEASKLTCPDCGTPADRVYSVAAITGIEKPKV